MTVESKEPYINYSIENLKKEDKERVVGVDADGKEIKVKYTVVEFDFYPDTSYQGYANVYELVPKNLIGATSKKTPNLFRIATTYPMTVPCPAYVLKGTVANAFVLANPTLVVDKNMDIFEYEGEITGNPRALDIRLVASIPSANEEKAMLGTINNINGDILSSSTGLPYPDGYNYKDNTNIVFKAYHFIKQKDGTYKSEEIPCRITEKGLEVIANNFSPFSIVAVDKNQNTPLAKKIVSVGSENDGGKITSAQIGNGKIGLAGLYEVEKDKTFKVEADTGHVIEKLMIDGKEISDAKGKTSYDHTYSADAAQTIEAVNINENANTLKVSFVADTVKEQERTDGIIVTVPELTTTVPTLEKLEVAANPVQTTYAFGEIFNTTGLQINAVYDDGTTKPLKKFTAPTTPLKDYDEEVTISYAEGGKTKKVNVKVKVTKVLTKIQISKNPSTTIYYTGQKFDPKGMHLELTYSDGDTGEVVVGEEGYEGLTWKPTDPLIEVNNDFKITVIYTNEYGKAEVDTSIRVDPNPVEKIEVTKPPSLTEYSEGDLFNPAGMEVVAYYEYGGVSKVLKDDEYSYTPTDPLTKDDKAITITYEGKSTTTGITVKAKESKMTGFTVKTQPSAPYFLGKNL